MSTHETSIAGIIAYLKQYYPTVETGALFRLQETLRLIEAFQFEREDKARVLNGWNALTQIKRILAEPTPEVKALEAKDVAWLTSKLAEAPDEKTTPNVRRLVKDIWTYPLQKYLPWCPLPGSHEALLAAANQALRELHSVSPRLVDGKIYVMLPGLLQKIWSVSDPKTLLPSCPDLQSNRENEHITVVNSDVVAKVQPEQLSKFLEASPVFDDIEPTDLKHTISLDWAPFSVCVVLGLKSTKLSEWVIKWNQTFPQAKIGASSWHLTIATRPRN